MAVACASRFAVLKLEDDEVEKVAPQNSKSNLSVGSAAKNKAGTSKNGSGADSKSKPKKKKKNNDVTELQNLAFGNGKTKSKGNSHGNTSKNTSSKQWEEWKKKDNEFVSEAYEQDLQEALLLSKIDYEEKKEVYDAIQKETEQSKFCTQAQKKKKKNSQKKEKGIMSLDEFQSLSSSQIESGNYKSKLDVLDDIEVPEKKPPLPSETDFFDKIEEDAEKIIDKEHKQDFYKDLDRHMVNDTRSLQFQEEILKKDEIIESLTAEVNKLKDELKVVKTRNKKLYGILATGEMREKAEILVQIEQLTSVKDELTDQLNEYHAALEQERSKVHALQSELKKFQSNRKEHKDSK